MSSARRLNAYVATWNVNGKSVKDDLSPWLTPSDQSSRPDIFVIGFQEFDLSKESFVQNDQQRFDAWRTKIEATIGLLGTYKFVLSSQLVGMMVMLFATPELSDQFTDIDSAMVGCGYVNVMGNKGAVALRLRLGRTTLCFVNSHLNAHVHNVRRRQADFESICSRLVFFSDAPVDVGLSNYPAILNNAENDDEGSENSKAAFEAENKAENLAGSESRPAPGPSTDGSIRIMDHDLIIWLGDLNYRIELPRDSLFKLIEARDWEALDGADQLRREMKASRVFQLFHEGPLRFLPSYKFNSGTDNYDSSPKMRLPAYCDRVLWRIRAPNISVDTSFYQSFMPLRASDHKPVAALLTISLPEWSSQATVPRHLTPAVASAQKRGYLSSIALRFIRKYAPYVVAVALLGFTFNYLRS